jgi:hypothetical protein
MTRRVRADLNNSAVQVNGEPVEKNCEAARLDSSDELQAASTQVYSAEQLLTLDKGSTPGQ